MIGEKAEFKGVATLTEVYEILEERRKMKEPTYEQEVALEHAKKYGMDKKKLEKLKSELGKDSNYTDRIISKISDIRPKNAMLLKQIFASENRPVTDEEVSRILSILKERG